MSFLSSVRGLLLASVVLPLAAYNPPTDKAGNLTVTIDGPQQITRTGVAVPVKVVLENAGSEALRVVPAQRRPASVSLRLSVASIGRGARLPAILYAGPSNGILRERS